MEGAFIAAVMTGWKDSLLLLCGLLFISQQASIRYSPHQQQP